MVDTRRQVPSQMYVAQIIGEFSLVGRRRTYHSTIIQTGSFSRELALGRIEEEEEHEGGEEEEEEEEESVVAVAFDRAPVFTGVYAPACPRRPYREITVFGGRR